jgi:hypothetical protein
MKEKLVIGFFDNERVNKALNATPLETLVPFNNGLIKDFTYKGISFFVKVVMFWMDNCCAIKC